MQPYKTLPRIIMINLSMSTGVCGEVNQDPLLGRPHIALCKLNTCPTLTKKTWLMLIIALSLFFIAVISWEKHS